MGELHLEVIVDRLKREFTVEQFNSGIPNAINTVQKIPVEVYKLEREETK